MYVVCSIGVYQPSVLSSVLVCGDALWESFQMLGELCAELWAVSQPVAEKTRPVELNSSAAEIVLCIVLCSSERLLRQRQ